MLSVDLVVPGTGGQRVTERRSQIRVEPGQNDVRIEVKQKPATAEGTSPPPQSRATNETGYGSSSHSLILLTRKEVQDELKLDPDQRAKLEEIAASAKPIIRDRTELHKKSVEWGKAAEKVLSPPQLTRFKEISLRVHGIAAMTDPIVTETLGITSDQLERLQAIQSQFSERLVGLALPKHKAILGVPTRGDG